MFSGPQKKRLKGWSNLDSMLTAAIPNGERAVVNTLRPKTKKSATWEGRYKMVFKDFKKAVQKQFQSMCDGEHLFTTNIDKEQIWDKYLASFPEGSNPIRIERTEHDCSACKSFIRQYANIVALKDNQIVSIWDIEIGGHYQVVADALSEMVKSGGIENVFLNDFPKLGTDFNHGENKDGTVTKWHHFFIELPAQHVLKSKDSIGTKLSDYRASKDVFKRSLEEISMDAIDTVLDLINQNSLYRGEEHKGIVETLLRLKKEYDKLPEDQKDNHCWVTVARMGGAAKIRNTVIGTLLSDISDGVDLDRAVGTFESKVAPSNYKRPNALITKKMVEDAREKIDELGFTDSLARRYAEMDDITINNVLFANRDTKKAMDVFDELKESVPVDPKQFSKVEEVSIDDFVSGILPTAEKIEVMFESKHLPNMVSLIAPENDSPSMFKWRNGFSWTYAGEVADSIKLRVKRAGGNVHGILRNSLAWFNTDDLDIHVREPDGNHIFFQNARGIHLSSGVLDVDMNVTQTVRNAVENIVWTDRNRMQEGKYTLYINNYTRRESIDVGFEVEVEFEGEIHTFSYPKPLRQKESVPVAEYMFSRKDGLVFVKTIGRSSASKEVWGIHTKAFQNVSMVMYSPNHWDGQGIGNRHYFFMLEGCRNDSSSRGFFNEFLREELMKQKRVFEALGSKMMAQPSDNQLSGLGFSSTQRNSLLCRVHGSFARTVKINF